MGSSSKPTGAAAGPQDSNLPEAPPKLVLAPLAPSHPSPQKGGSGAGSNSSGSSVEAAKPTAKDLAGCNLVGWGNNEDGQLVPTGSAHSGTMTEVRAPLRLRMACFLDCALEGTA